MWMNQTVQNDLNYKTKIVEIEKCDDNIVPKKIKLECFFKI